MRFSALAITVFVSSVIGVPAQYGSLRSHTLDARQQNLPIIKLPYGTYRATKYDKAADIYVFKNIRYAAPPVGNLRFAKTAPPENIDGIQDGTIGGSCPDVNPAKFMYNTARRSTGEMLSSLVKSFIMGRLLKRSATTEDCLFLDVVVPAKALNSDLKLPVLNWIYGGAYILGSKDGLYDGTPLVKVSNNSIIYVTANYRIAALGFMGGETVEKDPTAVANAGLYDQRAVLEWIQKYITLFGGDPKDVTAMGSSAGAGSILHHLTAFGGKQDPLFKKAVMQSPGLSPSAWDRKGVNEQVYKQFEKESGCEGKGIACLRGKDVSIISAAQTTVVDLQPGGNTGFGPVPDSEYVRQMPQLELLTGNFWRHLETIVVSHVTDEGDVFVTRQPINDDQYFLDLANREYANNTVVTKAIVEHMPLSNYKSQRDRIVKYVQFSTFTCNTRYITQAYKGNTYNVIYNGSHGFDVLADFWSIENPIVMAATTATGGRTLAKYQKYLVSLAQSGDLNRHKDATAPVWTKAKLGKEISNVLKVDTDLEFVKDPFNTADECDVWINALGAATITAGLSPPGGVFPTYLAPNTANASANYYATAPS